MKKSIHSSRRHKRRRSSSKRRRFQRPKIYSTSLAVALGLLGLLALFFFLSNDKPMQTGPHWAGNGASLIFDPHAHTSYSDAKRSPEELVTMAIQSGCDALVISDHSDKAGAVSDQQILELQALRDKHPYFLLFSGIELNMPSYGGREHAGLIADPLVETATLQRIRDQAERGVKRVKNGGASELIDEQLLQMIADYQSLSNDLLLVYNHPSRKDADIQENFADLTRWNARVPIFTAIEGAPGHQNAGVIGSYKEPYLTVDRWDPVVAEVGGVWDQLLSQGHQLWGALASSDYHNDNLDKAPCAFSRTHLIVPEESYRGVLRALKTGTFWADHGRILDQLWLSVDVDGMALPAHPGQTVELVDRDSMAVLSLSVQRGPGSVGQPLQVEFIGNCSSGEAEILAEQEILPLDTTANTLVPLASTGKDGSSCWIRARVRLSRASTTDYLAYTNPVRLILN